jgi:hypothetical protein
MSVLSFFCSPLSGHFFIMPSLYLDCCVIGYLFRVASSLLELFFGGLAALCDPVQDVAARYQLDQYDVFIL